jgi:hypothetical protein
MRSLVVALAIAAVLSSAGLRLKAGAAKSDAIAVDLKSFKFKVKEEYVNYFGIHPEEEKLFFYTNGNGEAAVKVPADGAYHIVIKASCVPALNERAKFKVSLDGQPVGKETLLSADDPKEYTLPATIKAGDRKLGIAFTNDAFKEGEYDRNLFIHAVNIKKVK